jgi:cytochrome c
MRKTATMVIARLALTGAALAAVQDPVQRGGELFNSTRLGTNGKSCSTCHPGGSKMEGAATYDDKELIKVVNQCIKESLAGKPPAAKSADMQALIKYIRTVAPYQGSK